MATPEVTKTNNKTFQGRIVQKHDTKANWDKATNFIPLKGEIIVYDDLRKIKIGDGTTVVVNLPYSTTTNYNDLSNKPTIPTNVSDLNDDVIDGNYLPLTGGDIVGSLTITNTGDQLQLNNIRFSSSTQATQCELYLKDPRGRTIRLNGIAYPQDDNDATNRQYVDDEIAKKSSVTIITWSDDGT